MNVTDIMRAREFAKEKHEGQVYGDLPYLYHLDMVAQMISGLGFDAEYSVLAYLHDTIEDGVSNYNEIRDNFGNDMAENVLLLTRDKDNETYNDYILNIKNFGGRLVNAVKICDLLCNLKECNQNLVGKNIGLAKKYEKAIVTLCVR